MEEEIWKDIKGYEGYYQVSNYGRVRSLDRYIKYSNNKVQFTKGKIISGFQKDNGYWSVDLYKGDGSKKFHKHRLVAEAFIPNPDNKPEVNHLDENKSNNYVDNLCWATSSENKNHGTYLERISKSHINNIKLSRKVSQYTLDGKLIKIYPSAKEAERQLGIPATSIIRNCRGRLGVKQCHGYIWEYTEESTAS